MLLQSNMAVSIISLQFKVYVHHTSHNVLHVYSTVKCMYFLMKMHTPYVLFPSKYKGELQIGFLI
jgi:hypothetical protein